MRALKVWQPDLCELITQTNMTWKTVAHNGVAIHLRHVATVST